MEHATKKTSVAVRKDYSSGNLNNKCGGSQYSTGKERTEVKHAGLMQSKMAKHSLSPGREQGFHGGLKVRNVACNQRQFIYLGSSCNEGIAWLNRTSDGLAPRNQPATLIRNREV